MIFAIGDLHLSFGLDKKKPMDVFGNKWAGHYETIKNNWEANVCKEDLVLVPGDVSWAMTEKEFEKDAEFIHLLPGKKVIMGGNHDFWWSSTTKLNNMYEDMFFLKNTCYEYEEGFFICGSRGWICPNDSNFTAHDLKIYKRELIRLKMSLDCAMRNNANRIIIMLHFPPFNDRREKTGFVEIIEQYPVCAVVYGHLHGDRCKTAVSGDIDGITYRLVSADSIKFNPIRVF